MENIKYTCDIRDCKKDAKHIKKPLMAIFCTEQTEGRIVNPYPSFVNLDLCDACLNKVTIEKKQVQAEGAQGYNTFWI